MEQNHLCNFSRGYYGEQFCDILFEFGPVVQEEMPFKDILSGAQVAFSFSVAKPFVTAT